MRKSEIIYMGSMFDRQSACPNKYYWFTASVEISVIYHYCQKVHEVFFQA